LHIQQFDSILLNPQRYITASARVFDVFGADDADDMGWRSFLSTVHGRVSFECAFWFNSNRILSRCYTIRNEIAGKDVAAISREKWLKESKRDTEKPELNRVTQISVPAWNTTERTPDIADQAEEENAA
jgi:hypothetical protein